VHSHCAVQRPHLESTAGAPNVTPAAKCVQQGVYSRRRSFCVDTLPSLMIIDHRLRVMTPGVVRVLQEKHFMRVLCANALKQFEGRGSLAAGAYGL
jgi:hypothetical protein